MEIVLLLVLGVIGISYAVFREKQRQKEREREEIQRRIDEKRRLDWLLGGYGIDEPELRVEYPRASSSQKELFFCARSFLLYNDEAKRLIKEHIQRSGYDIEVIEDKLKRDGFQKAQGPHRGPNAMGFLRVKNAGTPKQITVEVSFKGYWVLQGEWQPKD